MFKRILVAIDGTRASQRAFQTALALAEDQRAVLDIVHVLEIVPPLPAGPMGGAYVSADYVDAMTQALRRSGERTLAKAATEAGARGVSAETALVTGTDGSVADSILQQAKKRRADLVVVGTHGRRGLRRAVMGSDAEAVLRECRVPVLVVRGNARARASSSR